MHVFDLPEGKPETSVPAGPASAEQPAEAGVRFEVGPRGQIGERSKGPKGFGSDGGRPKGHESGWGGSRAIARLQGSRGPASHAASIRSDRQDTLIIAQPRLCRRRSEPQG